MLKQNSRVALTIDDPTYPYKVLTIRGTATVDTVDSVFTEYASGAVSTQGNRRAAAIFRES